MNARTQLQKVIARHRTRSKAPQKHPNDKFFPDIDFNSARKAAVLVLFGGANGRRLSEESNVEDLDVLFVQRASTLRKHAGQIAFPGGGVDPGDHSAADAALREAWEETGVDTDGIHVLGELSERELPVSNFLVTPVLGWWHTESEVYAVDHAESADVFRAPVAHLLAPRNRLTGVVQRDDVRFSSPAFDFHGRIIWGFTAIVLDDLFNELGWTKTWNTRRELRMV